MGVWLRNLSEPTCYHRWNGACVISSSLPQHLVPPTPYTAGKMGHQLRHHNLGSEPRPPPTRCSAQCSCRARSPSSIPSSFRLGSRPCFPSGAPGPSQQCFWLPNPVRRSQPQWFITSPNLASYPLLDQRGGSISWSLPKQLPLPTARNPMVCYRGK